MFFFHADLFYVASLYEGKSNSTRVSVKCFRESFAGISSDPAIFSDLPACCRPTDGPGVLINLTEKTRWQPFATWTIKLLSKYLTDGTLYVEGLISPSSVSAACSLFCYGDAALHMVSGSLLLVWVFSLSYLISIIQWSAEEYGQFARVRWF